MPTAGQPKHGSFQRRRLAKIPRTRGYFITPDASLAGGDSVEAGRLFTLSERIKQMLMPSERADLEKRFAVLRKREEAGSKTTSN
jgi:hypothetical protein